MGIYVIKMLDIGEGIVEVELVEWYVQVGDLVNEDQVFVEVMIDKVMVEIFLLVVGCIFVFGGQLGQVMVVGGELICLEVEGVGNFVESLVVVMLVVFVVVILEKLKEVLVVVLKVVVEVLCVLCDSEVLWQWCQFGECLLVFFVVCQCVCDLGIELQFVQGSGFVGCVFYEDFDVYLIQDGSVVCSGGVVQGYVE